MSELIACGLCGLEAHGTLLGRLVSWTPAAQRAREAPRFDTVDRCPDFQACRTRVEAKGQPWPLQESVTRPTVKQSPTYEEAPI